MQRHLRSWVLVAIGALVLAAPSYAQLSGAIFTTNFDGTVVNANIYPSKDAVYLDGGPGPGAPLTAASLPDGTYVFQVTDPPGKTLLSTDAAACRRFTVSGGIIIGVVAAGGCQHATHADANNPGGVTVQLIPFADTPNNGGEYKAWATPVADFLAGCAGLGVSNGLAVVDCGRAAGNLHGFVPRHSKTDNFKVNGVNREIDTHFLDAAGNEIVGLSETWIDTLGVSNPRFSLVNSNIRDFGWAHVEDVEDGVHQFTFTNQPGCPIYQITVGMPDGSILYYPGGPQTIDVHISPKFKDGTLFIYVNCAP
jgi:hypothetical protein